MTSIWSLGIDVGGTFTDLVAVSRETGAAQATKVLSTPHDQSEGVEGAIRAFVDGETGTPVVDRLVHGTTVVTNMLLERTGARVVLCATRGATDLLELRRQERASLYDLSRHHPQPLVDLDRVVPVDARVEPQGVVRPLTEAAVAATAASVRGLDPDIVAISLLHAYADATPERDLGAALRQALPDCDVVLSSDVLPEIREYERTATTVCEAYARPGVAHYLSRLTDRLGGLGLPAPAVMTSSGGMRTASDAARGAASLALSGPAGGVSGAALVARVAGFDQALTIDIGGTSADVGLVLRGEPLVEAGGSVAGVPIALPRVLVETVSAGGGSLGWVDDGGALRVGPRSAGARPGPVAFGRGGTVATVTDAHIALGNVRAARMSSGVTLDIAAAHAAVGVLARALGVDMRRCAQAMVETADAEMARALRRVSVERGIDPRSCVLVAFGGGGPLHACGLADRLGMRRILVPPFAGVLSALGLAVAPEQRVALASIMLSATADATPRLRVLADEARRRAGGDGRPAWIVRCRFRGQGHELEVPWQIDQGDAQSLGAAFVALHQGRYGFRLDAPVDLISLRCTVTATPPALALARHGGGSWDPQTAYDAGGAMDVTLRGPAVIGLPDATLLVADGWTARALPAGGWLMER